MSRNRRRAQPCPTQPKDVDGLFAKRTSYYRDELEIVLKGIFKLETPDDWDRDYILWHLIHTGHFVIANSIAGILPFRNSFSGINYMNLPTRAVINVPNLPEMTPKLNKECVLIYLSRQGDGYGFYTFNRTLDVYAEKLASADACIDVNLMNTRVAYVIEAETKAQAETIKEAYSKVTNGEPLVVLRKNSTDGKLPAQGMTAFFNNVKNNYIADLVQDSKRTIVNEFLTKIGINNANTDKKERLITGEVDSNNDELSCNVNHFKQNFEQQKKYVKKIFPDLKFDIGFEFDMSNERLEQIYATMGAGTNVENGTSASRVSGRNGN